MTATSTDRMLAVASREWSELKRNRSVLASAIVMPLMFTGMSVMFLQIVQRAPNDPKEYAKLPPSLAALGSSLREVMANQMGGMVLMLFLLMPATIPSIMAAHSIVGEKMLRTLEPLLATPIRTGELVRGKMLTAVLVGVIPSWCAFAAYCILAFTTTSPDVARLMVTARGALIVLVLGPPLAVLAVSLAMMVSARANDLQSAQAWSGMLVLPVIGLAISQMLGVVVLGPARLALGAVVLAAAAGGAYSLCVGVFERESILTRWK